MTYDQKASWVENVDLVSHNSIGKVDEESQVEVRFTIAANYQSSDDIKSRGWFEMSGPDTDRWYSSGGLWFKRNELVDFDGSYSLPKEFIHKLHEWGFDVKEMARCHKYDLE